MKKSMKKKTTFLIVILFSSMLFVNMFMMSFLFQISDAKKLDNSPNKNDLNNKISSSFKISWKTIKVLRLKNISLEKPEKPSYSKERIQLQDFSTISPSKKVWREYKINIKQLLGKSETQKIDSSLSLQKNNIPSFFLTQKKIEVQL